MRYRLEHRAALIALLIAALLLTWSAATPRPATAGTAAAISTSEATTCVVRSDGTVWCWGDNRYGQLGNGTTSVDIVQPIQAAQVTTVGGGPLQGVIAIAAGQVHECALKTDGTVWCWGYHYYGNLGNGVSGVTPGLDCHYQGGCGTSHAVQVVSVPGGPLTNVLKVIAGRMHTCALRVGGTVRCWGYNGEGELGDGTATNRSTAVQVTQGNANTLFTNAADVAAGGGTSCASKTDGTAWCWGWNAFGQVGDGTTRDRRSAVRVKASKQALLPADVLDMVGGYHFNCARRSDTSVWCWGSDQLFAQPVLKGGASFLGTVQLAAHVMHVCARKGDGTVWCWGDNSVGQLGDGSGLGSDEPVQVRVAPAGPPLADAIDLSRGSYAFYTCVRRQDMSPWCWGDNAYGQVGDGTFTDRPNPVEASVFPSF
jgi:alpha-tubulin suppressor-like RCC1 family protein